MDCLVHFLLQLNRVLAPATKAAKRAEAALKELAAENAALKASPDPQKANELRIRDNLSSTLTRKFGEVRILQNLARSWSVSRRESDFYKDVCRQCPLTCDDICARFLISFLIYSDLFAWRLQVVKEYQKHQVEYKDDVKKKVARQVRIVKEDATDAEIDEVMASGGTQQVLQSAILRTAADPVREAFEKAQDKYRDVQRLGQVNLHPKRLCMK